MTLTSDFVKYYKGRLGSAYRLEMLHQLSMINVSGRVLDVGCYDGFFLSTLKPSLGIAVDLDPHPAVRGLNFIKANGCKLPFSDKTFDFIFAIEILEHVQEDFSFADSLVRVLAPGGRLFLSTPHKNIRITPGFLTNWASHKWGHIYRNGYLPEELTERFSFDGLEIAIHTWNAQMFRSWYLVLRMMKPVFPTLTNQIMRKFAQMDARFPEGDQGWLWMEAVRKY